MTSCIRLILNTEVITVKKNKNNSFKNDNFSPLVGLSELQSCKQLMNN